MIQGDLPMDLEHDNFLQSESLTKSASLVDSVTHAWLFILGTLAHRKM